MSGKAKEEAVPFLLLPGLLQPSSSLPRNSAARERTGHRNSLCPKGNGMPGQDASIFVLLSHSCREILIHLFLRKRKGNCSSATCRETRRARLTEDGY